MPQSATFHIPALDCPEELMLIERGLRKTQGIRQIVPDYLARDLRVEFDDTKTDLSAVASAVQRAGFAMELKRPSDDALSLPVVPSPSKLGIPRTMLVGGVLLVCAGISAASLNSVFWPTTALVVASTIASGLPVAAAAWRALRLKAVDIHVLMTIAAIGAIAIGDYFEAATAMFLFALSLWLERMSLFRAQRAIHSLVELTPTMAHRLLDPGTKDEQVLDVHANQLRVGDIVLVRPGERIPVDGLVLSGESLVDQAPITGESLPAQKGVDNSVFAGTLNGAGSLMVRATADSKQTTLANIARLIDKARAARSRTERFIDKFARRYTPAVVGLALLIMIGPPLLSSLGLASFAGTSAVRWIHRGLVLLVIACPCALVIATPITIVSALHRATRAGILVKGGEVLEKLAVVRNLAFDKTGTLTTGHFRVIGVETFDGHSTDEVLGIAAALERHSQHPIAAAVTDATNSRGLAVPPLMSISAQHGLGVSGNLDGDVFYLGNPQFFRPSEFTWISGDAMPLPGPKYDANTTGAQQNDRGTTQIWLATRQQLWGTLQLADALRSDAASAVRALRQMGIERIALLTGDAAAMAAKVAAEVGIDEVYPQLLPAQKVEQMKHLTACGVSAMIGDGVNDAPAMAAADVGVALGSQSSATAMETADVVVMSSSLEKLPELISLARRCRSVLRQNIAFSLATKLAVIGLAAGGYATMWMAVLADVGASLAVIANGLRLIKPTSKDEIAH